jgi:glycosyltransferase involved in cell wall biosynthesis
MRHGHSFEVLSAADTINDGWVEGFPVRVHCAGPAFSKYAFSPRVRAWLESNIASYDVVVIDGVWQAHTRVAARVSRAAGIPYFIYTHGHLDPWNRKAHPIKYLKKLCYWRLFEKRSLESAEALVFTSDEEARLAARYLPSAKWTALVAGSGIDTPASATEAAMGDLRRKLQLPEHGKVWLFLSRLHPKKGLETLLSVFSCIERHEEAPILLIAGEGDPEYVSKLRSSQTGKSAGIVWAGPLYGSEKSAAYCLAEVFLLPTHQENFGIVLAEALGSGVPVITTRSANIWPQISDCGAGIVCEDSEDAFRGAVEAWLGLDHDRRRAMGEAARRCFAGNFEIGISARRLLSAFEAAKHRRGGRGSAAGG